MFFKIIKLFAASNSSKLVSPSLLGFLSPGNGGSEGSVKTIEDGRGFPSLHFSTHDSIIKSDSDLNDLDEDKNKAR